MTGDKRQVAAFVILGAIIIWLLFREWGEGDTTIINEGDGGNITVVTPETDGYELPPLILPSLPGYNGGPFDWMQSTDLLCGCDTGFKAQIYIEPPPPPPKRPSIAYVYLDPPPLALPPAPAFSFPPLPPPAPYVPPPPQPAYIPPPMPPIIVEDTRPRFSWGWSGLQRVVRLDNGTELKAGLSNRKFTLYDDGSILYKGFRYWPY